MLGIAQQLAQVVETQNRNTAPPANVVPQNQLFAQAQDQMPTFADDDYLTGKQVKAFAQQFQQQQAPQFQQLQQMAASNSLGLVQQKYADAFRKYGPEIHATIAGLPKAMWTVDNLDQAVSLVRSRHFDEELADRLNTERQRLLSEIPPTMRPTGGAGPANPNPIAGQPSLNDATVNASWRARAESVGMTDETVDEFCRANNMSRADFFKQFEKPMGVVVEEIKIAPESQMNARRA